LPRNQKQKEPGKSLTKPCGKNSRTLAAFLRFYATTKSSIASAVAASNPPVPVLSMRRIRMLRDAHRNRYYHSTHNNEAVKLHTEVVVTRSFDGVYYRFMRPIVVMYIVYKCGGAAAHVIMVGAAGCGSGAAAPPQFGVFPGASFREALRWPIRQTRNLSNIASLLVTLSLGLVFLDFFFSFSSLRRFRVCCS
jgi:hypothetical protein